MSGWLKCHLLWAAKGLAFIHSDKAKVIYRHFKTSNVLLDSSYIAKLSDFGLAKDGSNDDKSHVSTRVMGTHDYASPQYLAIDLLQQLMLLSSPLQSAATPLPAYCCCFSPLLKIISNLLLSLSSCVCILTVWFVDLNKVCILNV